MNLQMTTQIIVHAVEADTDPGGALPFYRPVTIANMQNHFAEVCKQAETGPSKKPRISNIHTVKNDSVGTGGNAPPTCHFLIQVFER